MPDRKPTTKHAQLVLLVLLLVATGLAAQQDEETRTRRQLERLKQDISSLSADLKADLARRSTLRDALRRSEEAIGRIRREIKQTRDKLIRSRSQLDDLREQRQDLLVARGRQEESINREIQRAYQMGKQTQLKILLNQEDPARLARAMVYYDYFYQARRDEIDRYLEIIERIDTITPEIVHAFLDRWNRTTGEWKNYQPDPDVPSSHGQIWSGGLVAVADPPLLSFSTPFAGP